MQRARVGVRWSALSARSISQRQRRRKLLVVNRFVAARRRVKPRRAPAARQTPRSHERCRNHLLGKPATIEGRHGLLSRLRSPTRARHNGTRAPPSQPPPRPPPACPASSTRCRRWPRRRQCVRRGRAVEPARDTKDSGRDKRTIDQQRQQHRATISHSPLRRRLREFRRR